MASFLNPSLIANSVQQPPASQSPLSLAEGVSRVQQLQQANQQQAAMAPVALQQGQANVQSTQLANQQSAQELKDQQAFGQAVAQSGGDPDKLEAAIAPITSPKVRLAAESTISQLRARAASTTVEQDKVTAARNQQFLSQLQAIREAQDPAVRQSLWQQTATAALAAKDPNGQPLLTSQHLDPNTVPDDGTLQAYETYLDRSGQFMTGLAKRKADLAKAATDQVAAENAQFSSAVQSIPNDVSDPDIQSKWATWRASLPPSKQAAIPAQFSPSAVANAKLATVETKDQPKYIQEKRQADAAQNMTPQTVEQSIAAGINPAEHPQDFKDALNRATVSLKGGTLSQNVLDGIIKDYTDRFATERSEVSRATNPAIIGAEVGKSVAIQNALKRSDNPDLANVPTASVKDVQDKAFKLEQDYSKAKTATDTLGRVLDLADQGNAVAGTNVASLGSAGVNAVNGIKRINPASVEGYGNAGSLLDTIQGKLKKWDGKGPLDQNLLDQIRELHQTLGQQAYQGYQDGYKSLKSVYNADLKPTQPAPNISKSSKITVTDPAGGVHTFPDQASADKFKKLANIQ
jgi:hypothetical protein